MTSLHPLEQAAIKRGVALPTILGKQAESERLAAELAEWLAAGGSVTYDAPLPYVPRPVCTYYAPDIIIRPRFAPKVSPQVAQMRQNCDAIIECLRVDGASYANELAEKLGFSNSSALHYLKKLYNANDVILVAQVGSTKVYDLPGRDAPDLRSLAGVNAHSRKGKKVRERIIKSLRAAGVMSLTDLADSVDRTIATAGRHVRMLIDDGVVKPCGSVEGDQTYTKRMYMLV